MYFATRILFAKFGSHNPLAGYLFTYLCLFLKIIRFKKYEKRGSKRKRVHFSSVTCFVNRKTEFCDEIEKKKHVNDMWKHP